MEIILQAQEGEQFPVVLQSVDIQQPCGGGLGDIAVSLASELLADEILDA